MVEEVRRQVRVSPGILNGTTPPDYDACIRIATSSSISEMFLPAAIVIGKIFA